MRKHIIFNILGSAKIPKMRSKCHFFMNFLTLNVSKKSLIGLMIAIYVFKSIPKRSTTRSRKNHDHVMRSEKNIDI